MRAGRGLAVALAAFTVMGACAAESFGSDANRAHSFVVGPSPGLANCEWLDAGNTSRARTHFPDTPEVVFRIRVPGGIGQAPASDAAGNLIIVHGEARVSKLDRRGRTLWSKRIESEAASAPVLTSDGTILLLTHHGEALLIGSSGKLLHRGPVPFSELRHRILAIPTANGGALLASGTEIVELAATGEVTRQTRTPANVTGLAQAAANLLAICENGALALAHASGDFEVIGNLGGTAPEGGALQNGKVYAVVDAHKLVAFDLPQASAVVLASDPSVGFTGPPMLFDNESSVMIADGGFLSLRAPGGSETLRASIGEASRAFDPAMRALRPALAVADAGGAVAAARGDSDAIILAPDGKAQRLESTSCLDPFRPTPIPGGVVFACRSGQLFGVSDRAP